MFSTQQQQFQKASHEGEPLSSTDVASNCAGKGEQNWLCDRMAVNHWQNTAITGKLRYKLGLHLVNQYR